MVGAVITGVEALLIVRTAGITSVGSDTLNTAVEAVLCDHSAGELFVIAVDPGADDGNGRSFAGEIHIMDGADGALLST